MDGYVFKWVNFIKGWKPRYLILENNFLKFSVNKNDEAKKIIELSNAKVIDEKKKKNFVIEFGDKKIHIKTNTEDEKKAWILKIIEGISSTKSRANSEIKKYPSIINKDKYKNKDKTFNKEKDNAPTSIEIPSPKQIKTPNINPFPNLNPTPIQNPIPTPTSNFVPPKTEVITFQKSQSYILDQGNNFEIKQIENYIENNINPSKNKRFSESYKTYYKEINKNKYNSSSIFDIVINNYLNLQNLFLEFNLAMEDFNLHLMSLKSKSKDKEELTKIYVKFFNIKQEMRERLDDSMKTLIDYKEEIEDLSGGDGIGVKSEIRIGEDYIPNNKNDIELEIINEDVIKPQNETFYCAKEDEEEITTNNNEIKIDYNNEIKIENDNEKKFENYKIIENIYENENYIEEDFENNSSFEDCISFHKDLTTRNNNNEDEEESEFKASLEKSILLESDENRTRFKRSLSTVQSDFYDHCYNFEIRKNLPFVIKCSSSMLTDMLKSLTKDKISLPVHYNEPISMLQKQCEKFQYSNLLTLGARADSVFLKLSYIAAFMVSELSLNINRILKPFNPILGETFEYIDNPTKYRYFSEQVSHNPPISAFICESEDFAVFGDTRCKNKFKIFQRAMELIFFNKTNIIFKKGNGHFTYDKPTVYLKGIIMGTPHYDFSGVVTIEDVNNKNQKLVLDFFEEGRKSKSLGYFEGKCYDGADIIYLVQGNWNSSLWITDKDGNNKQEIWKINEDEFIKNSDICNNYLISTFACNLNNLPLECSLNKKLPPTDSRFRPDQRALEGRKIEFAESEKNRMEIKQRSRHKQFEEEKIKYEPKYFAEVLDSKTGEYIYLHKGTYWTDRKNENFGHLYDIFA